MKNMRIVFSLEARPQTPKTPGFVRPEPNRGGERNKDSNINTGMLAKILHRNSIFFNPSRKVAGWSKPSGPREGESQADLDALGEGGAKSQSFAAQLTN